MHRGDIQAGQQHHHIGSILREGVAGRIAQPVTAATSHDIRTDDAIIHGQRSRQFVEISPIACQTMYANQDVRILRLAPSVYATRCRPEGEAQRTRRSAKATGPPASQRDRSETMLILDIPVHVVLCGARFAAARMI